MSEWGEKKANDWLVIVTKGGWELSWKWICWVLLTTDVLV